MEGLLAFLPNACLGMCVVLQETFTVLLPNGFYSQGQLAQSPPSMAGVGSECFHNAMCRMWLLRMGAWVTPGRTRKMTFP